MRAGGGFLQIPRPQLTRSCSLQECHVPRTSRGCVSAVLRGRVGLWFVSRVERGEPVAPARRQVEEGPLQEALDFGPGERAGRIVITAGHAGTAGLDALEDSGDASHEGAQDRGLLDDGLVSRAAMPEPLPRICLSRLASSTR